MHGAAAQAQRKRAPPAGRCARRPCRTCAAPCRPVVAQHATETCGRGETHALRWHCSLAGCPLPQSPAPAPVAARRGRACRTTMPGAMPRASSSSHIAVRSRARFSACSAIGTRSVSPPRQKNGSGASSAAAEAAARAAKHATAWRRGAAAGAAVGLIAARWRAGAPRCANPGCATPRHARATRMAAKSGACQLSERFLQPHAARSSAPQRSACPCRSGWRAAGRARARPCPVALRLRRLAAPRRCRRAACSPATRRAPPAARTARWRRRATPCTS